MLKRSFTSKSLALLGFGRMGKIRANLVTNTKAFELKYIVDSTPSVAKDAKAYQAGFAQKLEDVIDSVDAVMISTPTLVHYRDIVKAIESKKPVMVEKPLTNSKKENAEIYRLAESLDVPVVCNFMRRSSKAYQQLKEKMEGQHLHSIYMAGNDHPTPPPEILRGLGSLYEDMAVHEIDTALWFMNEKPLRALAVGFRSFGSRNTDNATIVLEFPGNRRVTIESSRFHPEYHDSKIEVIGARSSGSAKHVGGKSFGESFAQAFEKEVIDFRDLVNSYYERKKVGLPAPKLPRPYHHDLWINDIIESLHRSETSGRFEAVQPDNVHSVGIIGNGGFSKFVQQEVLGQHLGNRFCVNNIFTSKKQFSGERSDVLYVASPDKCHKTHVDQAIKSGSSVIVTEKPCFLNSQQHQETLQHLKDHPGVTVFINLQRRLDDLYNRAKFYVNTHRKNVRKLNLTARDPVPYGAVDTVPRMVYNSMIHDIDSVVWLLWPFAGAAVKQVSWREGVVRVNILVNNNDGSSVEANIDFAKAHPSYLNRIEVDINSSASPNKVKSEEFTVDHVGPASKMSVRYLDAYVRLWAALAPRLQQQRSTAAPAPALAEMDITHPSFVWTFKLLEQALNQAENLPRA